MNVSHKNKVKNEYDVFLPLYLPHMKEGTYQVAKETEAKDLKEN